jgi:carbamoyl-phosphate synthase large subunit
MAIGSQFAESLQKALRSLETGLTGLNSARDAPDISTPEGRTAMQAALTKATPMRFDGGRCDPPRHERKMKFASSPISTLGLWTKLQQLIEMEAKISAHGLPDHADAMRAGQSAWAFLMRVWRIDRSL